MKIIFYSTKNSSRLNPSARDRVLKMTPAKYALWPRGSVQPAFAARDGSLSVHPCFFSEASTVRSSKNGNSKFKNWCVFGKLGLGLCGAAMEDRASELTRLIAASSSLYRHHKHSCHRELGLQQLPFPHTRCPRFVCVCVTVCLKSALTLTTSCYQRMSESWTRRGQEHGAGEPHQH
jgi:hypothetical protein